MCEFFLNIQVLNTAVACRGRCDCCQIGVTIIRLRLVGFGLITSSWLYFLCRYQIFIYVGVIIFNRCKCVRRIRPMQQRRQQQHDKSSLPLPLDLYWSRPSNTIMTAENWRCNNLMKQEVKSWSRLNDGGGLTDVAEDGKIVNEKKVVVLRKLWYSKEHGENLFVFILTPPSSKCQLKISRDTSQIKKHVSLWTNNTNGQIRYCNVHYVL